MRVAIAGWLAGLVEGMGVGLLLGGANVYTAFSFVLGGLALWITVCAGIVPLRGQDRTG